MITYFLWILFLILEGMEDAWMYRFLPIRYRYIRNIHVIHAVALVRRLGVLAIIVYFTPLWWPAILTLVSLWLMLPFIQTGSYMQMQTILTRLYDDLGVIADAKGKPYGFFSYAHKQSSRFPDKNPWLRLLYFLVGSTIFFYTQNVLQ
jgi:hypothetical protein